MEDRSGPELACRKRLQQLGSAVTPRLEVAGATSPIGSPQYCVTADGKRFLFGEAVDASKSFTVVLNWSAGLKR